MLSTTSAVPAFIRAARPKLQLALVLATSLTAFAVRLSAQAPVASGGFELRPYVGAFIPTGDQRDLLKDAAVQRHPEVVRLLSTP